MNELYYKSRGNLKCGFMLDPVGKPYLLAHISYDGSENLLDNYRDDRGREFQSCLLDGFIDHSAGDDFYVNTTNPTHGGGNYGDAVPTVTKFKETLFTLEVELPAFDYMPHNYGGEMKPYKAGMLAGRYPETGWSCRVKYTLKANSVLMENEYFITDGRLHHVYFYRPMVLHLNPVLFDHNLVNESKRDFDSFLQAVIMDNHITAISVDNKIQVKATSAVTSPAGLYAYYSHRCFRQADRTVPAPPGTDDVWEAMLVTEPMQFATSATRFRGWAKIELQPVKIGFDLAKMIKNVFKAINERKSEMQIVCNDGTKSVAVRQFVWLKTFGHLRDMSNYPGADPNQGHFTGSCLDLSSILVSMPAGWTIPTPPPVEPPVVEPPVVEPPVVEPTEGFEQEVLDRLDEIIGLLSTMAGQ